VIGVATVARLFVGVRPPDHVLDELAALPRAAEPGVRYTTRDQWHITLRFLGQAEVGDAAAALERLDSPSAEARLGPQVSRLGRDVVVVPVGGLEQLAADVAAVTAAVGDPPDPRPFAGHLTLARLRRRGACRIAGAPLSTSFAVEEVELVRSRLDPAGARYDVIAIRRLRTGE
jgi:2'-5' RNA ligase